MMLYGLPALSMNGRSEIVDPDILAVSSSSMDGLQNNGLALKPVAGGESGEGLPYAPMDWPNPGDVWGWRAGKRKLNSGFIADRCLILPRRLRKSSERTRFESKFAVKEYLQKEFPNADINAFFASFSWKIPCKDHSKGISLLNDGITVSGKYEKEGMISGSKSKSKSSRNVDCKAGNKKCKPHSNRTPVMDCNICCSEPGFCRDCCCIFCCKIIDWAHGGFSFIRCEVRDAENHICGHVTHMDCAVQSYMAATSGGSFGLDVEYYCRRCDKRTNLVPHVTRLLRTCRYLDSRDEVKKILTMGLSILHGSQQESAKMLLKRMDVVLEKLSSGTHLEEIWNVEDNSVAFPAGKNGILPGAFEDTHDSTTTNEFRNSLGRRSQQPVYIMSEHQIETLKLDEKIGRVLQELRNSQELEYRIAEESLHAQKDFLLGLYQELDSDRSELARCSLSIKRSDAEALFNRIKNKVNQIKREGLTLKDMEEVAKGFARVPKGILKEHFDLEIED